MTAASYLHNRWNKELKYWRLRWWQFALLLLWSAWSLICGWLFPAHPELWLFPQAPFLAFGYLGGGLFMFIFRGNHGLIHSAYVFTVFCSLISLWSVGAGIVTANALTPRSRGTLRRKAARAPELRR